MGLLNDIQQVGRKKHGLTKAGQQAEQELLGSAKPSIHELAAMPSVVQMNDAVASAKPEAPNKISLSVSPILRSFSMETDADIETALERLVGGEFKLTIRFR
jgi:hypothetical protein